MRKIHGRLCLTALLIFALIGSISFAAATDEANDKSIVGFWFGARRQKATNIEMLEICHFKPDGTFSITFRKMKDGKLLEEQNESGRWERNQNVKTLVTTHIHKRRRGEVSGLEM